MNFRDHFTHHNPALSLPAGISGWKKGEIKIFSSFYPKSNPAERLKSQFPLPLYATTLTHMFLKRN